MAGLPTEWDPNQLWPGPGAGPGGGPAPAAAAAAFHPQPQQQAQQAEDGSFGVQAMWQGIGYPYPPYEANGMGFSSQDAGPWAGGTGAGSGSGLGVDWRAGGFGAGGGGAHGVPLPLQAVPAPYQSTTTAYPPPLQQQQPSHIWADTPLNSSAGLGTRRVGGFNLHLDLAQPASDEDRPRKRPPPPSNVPPAHPHYPTYQPQHQYHQHHQLPSRHNSPRIGGGDSTSSLASYASGVPGTLSTPRPSRPSTPPLRPRGPSPVHRSAPRPTTVPSQAQADPRVGQLALARTTSSIGLPEVRGARDMATEVGFGNPGWAELWSTPSPVHTPLTSTRSNRTCEVNLDCRLCGQPGVKLVLRGTAIQQPTFKPRATFTCVTCFTAQAGPTPIPTPDPGSTTPTRLSYHQTLSAAIDRIVGLETTTESPALPRSVTLPKLSPAEDGIKLTCDCCQLGIGVGQVVDLAEAKTSKSQMTTEVLCAHCLSLYKLCSDCGGGGGRLSIGRWRCRELFPHGRKTCRLSHARHSRLHELEFSTIAVKDLDPSTADSLASACRLSHVDSRLQFTARPLCIEHGLAPCRTYAEAERLTIDDWNMIRPCLTDDVEASRGVRRYISFSSGPAASRRAKYQAKSGAGTSPAATSILSGFVIGEWDMDKGTLHWVCMAPWGRTGEVADGLSAVCVHSVAQVRRDRAVENDARQRAGQQLLPELRCIWTLSPFDFANPTAARLGTNRGFEPLAEARQDPGFVAWEAGLAHLGGGFPPERECHIPTQYTGVYQVVVRLLAGEGDPGGPPEEAEARRRRKGAGVKRGSGSASPLTA